jgi:surface protein
MKKLLFLLSVFTVLFSCSKDETPPPAPIVKYTITLSAGEGGTVSTTGGEYEAGQTVSVTATPQGEYLFKNWSDGNTNATRTITVSSNTTLTANFEKKKYPLTVNIEGEGEVLEEIVNAGRTTDYDSGTTVKLTAVPAEGWEFVGWTGAIESTELEVQIVMGEPKEVTVTFEKKKYPLTVNIEGEGEVIEEIVNAGRTTDYNSGTAVKLTAVPAEGWEFVGWTGAIESTELEVQIVMGEPKEVTVTFEKKKYPLTVNIEGEGEVLEEIVNASKTTDYDSGTTVKLTAVPAEGWEFVGWTGAINGTSNPQQLLISEPKTVLAVFKLNPIYLDENGVTIKAYDWAEVGDKGIIDGVEYTIVNESTLREMVANDEDVTKVVTTKVTNMGNLFQDKTGFNQDISTWDVSNALTLRYIFFGATSFNQDISSWNTKNVTDMVGTFRGATAFNQDIGGWNVSSVRDFGQTFLSAVSFNQDIGSWNTNEAVYFRQMFQNANTFNQDISSWNVNNVLGMGYMFYGATLFNQDIGDWNTSNVTDMSNMFNNATAFNQDLIGWNVPLVTNCSNFSLNSNVSWTQKPNFTNCTP